MHNHTNKSSYTLKNFLPLILIFMVIIVFVAVKQSITGFAGFTDAMNDFMGAFFIIFGCFKIINLRAFAQAYSMYDLLAQRSRAYAFVYPFIELALGILYLTRAHLMVTHIVTLIIMLFSALGVARALSKHETMQCACLGTVFKLPMTYVTLFEDLVMAAMALWGLLY